jgi:hypothetical protein
VISVAAAAADAVSVAASTAAIAVMDFMFLSLQSNCCDTSAASRGGD